MHFKVLSSQALASALKAAFAFTDNWDTEELDRPPVCFSFDSNTLTIHSCYKEMYGIYAHFEAFVDITGAYQVEDFCIDSDDLYESIKNLEDMELTFDEIKFFGFKITSGQKLAFSIEASHDKNYTKVTPGFIKSKALYLGNIRHKDLMKICSKQKRFLTRMKDSAITNNLWIDVDGSNRLLTAATNSHVLSYWDAPVENVTLNKKITILKRFVDRVKSMFEGIEDQDFYFSTDGNLMKMSHGFMNAYYPCPKDVKANIYSYKKEEDLDEGFYVNRKVLLTVLDRFEGLFREYHSKTLVFHFCGDAVYVHKKDDAFEYHDKIAVDEGDAGNLILGFNPYFLRMALETSDCETIKIVPKDEKQGVLFYGDDCDSYLVMPTLLEDEEKKLCKEASVRPYAKDLFAWDVETYTLGKPFPKSKKAYPGDYSRAMLNEESFDVIISLSNLTDDEKTAILDGPIHVAVYFYGCVPFVVLNFGGIFKCDISLNLKKVKDSLKHELWCKKLYNMVRIFLLEGTSTVLRGIRYFEMQGMDEIRDAGEEQLSYSLEEVDGFIQSAMTRVPQQTMIDQADVRFDVDEPETRL